MKIKISNWRSLLIKIYILANIIDAGGGLGLKYASSLILLILLIGKSKIKFNYIECILFLVCPIALVAYAIVFCGVSVGAAVSSVTFCLAILFSIVLINEKIVIDDILRFFMKTMCCVSIVTIILFIVAYVMNMVGMASVFMSIGRYLQYSKRMGFLGYNYISGIFMPVVYFRCSMFLIFAQAVACYYKDKKSIILIFIANMLVTTTANILFTMIIMMCYLFGNSCSKKFKVVTGFFGGSAIVGILVIKFNDIYSKFYEYFDDLTMKSDSSAVKMGHIMSIVENMFSSVRYFLFGMGGGSSFYSSGVEKKITNSEVSQLECWRKFGTIYTLMFFLYILYVMYKLYKVEKKSRILSIGLGILFLSTATNPQLLSPLFLMLLFLCNSWCNEQTRNKKIVQNSKNINCIQKKRGNEYEYSHYSSYLQ